MSVQVVIDVHGTAHTVGETAWRKKQQDLCLLA